MLSDVSVFSGKDQLARNGSIKWTLHVKERMKERGITILQIKHCLSKGRVVQIEDNDNEEGGYIARIEKVAAGVKIRVVVHLESSQGMIKIITVIAI